jgi:hypothetical protein
MNQVLSGAWKRDGKTVIFIINLSSEVADYNLSYDEKLYEIDKLPKDAFGGTLSPREIKVIEV